MGMTTEDAARAVQARTMEAPPDRARLLTTLCFPKRPAWGRRFTTLEVDHSSPIRTATRVVLASRRYALIVLNGDGSPRGELAAAAILNRQPRPPTVIFADCAWSARPSRFGGLVDRAAVRMIDGAHVH